MSDASPPAHAARTSSEQTPPASPSAAPPSAATPSAAPPFALGRELLWLVPLAALVAPLFVRFIRSADFWWHLATGRWMVENGAIPRTDPFSFTAAGQPWHYVSWPAEWLLFRVWDIGGAGGIVALRVACVSAVLIGLGLVCRALGVRRLITAALLLAVAIVVQPRYTLDRPMLVGAVLLVACLWTSVRWWPRGGWSILAVPLVTALWLPTHGAGIVGVACGLGALASAALFRRDRRWLVPGAVAGITCAVLLGATVAGREIVEHLLLLGDAGRVTEYIQEWGSPSPAEPENRLPFVLIVFGTLSAVVGFRRHPLPAGAAFIGAYLGLQHVRGLTEGVLLVLPMAAVGLEFIAARAGRSGLALVERVVPPALVLLLVAVHFAMVDRPLAGIPGVGIDDRRMPSDSIEVLRALPEGRTMNNMDIGGYLIWERVPGGVFVDGRILALYTAEQFDDLCVATLTDESEINRVADLYDIRYAVASHVSVMGRLLMRARSWIPVFHGRSTSVYVRRADELAMRRAGYWMFDDLRYDLDVQWMHAWYGEVLADAERTETLVRQVADGAVLSPPSPVALEVLRYLDAHHPAVARRVEAAVEAGPSEPDDR